MAVEVKETKEVVITWEDITAEIKDGLRLTGPPRVGIGVEGYTTSTTLGYSLERAIMGNPKGFVEFAQAICDNLAVIRAPKPRKVRKDKGIKKTIVNTNEDVE